MQVCVLEHEGGVEPNSGFNKWKHLKLLYSSQCKMKNCRESIILYPEVHKRIIGCNNQMYGFVNAVEV